MANDSMKRQRDFSPYYMGDALVGDDLDAPHNPYQPDECASNVVPSMRRSREGANTAWQRDDIERPVVDLDAGMA